MRVGPVVEEDGTEVTPARSYPYDTLVLAVGSLTNDFGTPGVVDYAISLETPELAAKISTAGWSMRASAPKTKPSR